ncbi:ribonuclease H2 subunit B [Colletotrichum spaethianum]|uniref:Ribonuclease n=1 Tax=Colletotrichum spaethianum TaxID=700344 RepID=A0AA37LLS6_9PEZI|nr:ribonuclease H2 subunit B [Colletotrichum spaethianum]GKT47022.1 ribonuclease H2 subunit B [Colletotrichum spaethianum]
MEDPQTVEDIALETPVSDVFIPPSINDKALLSGDSYTYFSPVPPTLLPPSSSPTKTTSETPASGTPVCLGVDEAGRGPVLGPMVYGVFYLPIPLSDPLLRETHHFDDSKVLTPAVRSQLMAALCTAGSDLAESCGFAVSALSARDISSGMMRPGANYNLNAQAMDATVELIKGVFAQGVNVQEIYVDTVGQPAAYQAKLQRFFPATKITVAKKADSLYPCVSAASVCAKVTRDAALEVLYKARAPESAEEEGMAWGSGYPSDGRCVSWMKSNMHPVFGWGPECRFSWGTAKDMLEGKGCLKVDWPVEDDADTARMTDFFVSGDNDKDGDELGTWFGRPAGLEAF